jgi:hypothetical protein
MPSENPHGTKHRKTVPFADFVNTITLLDGRPIAAGKKPWKPRADKGKPRAMRKNVVAAS